MKRKVVVLLLTLAMIFSFGGCNDSKKKDDPKLASIVINGVDSLLVGASSNYSAKGFLTDNTSQDIVPVWSTSPASIATIDAAGKLTALAKGTVIITAAKDGISANKSVAVKIVPAKFSWNNATVYFVITDRFKNGRTDNDQSYGRVPAEGQTIGTFHGGDLKGLTEKINDGYFNDLGVNAIWITSPLEQIHGWVGGGTGDFQHFAYHGYYNMDYTEIDANMGTKEELKTFIDTAHENGIRVLFDVVLNHPGYGTLADMTTFGFGAFKTTPPAVLVKPAASNWHWYHDIYINYDTVAPKSKTAEWGKWWGKDWIRAGISDYTPGGSDDLTKCLDSTPDFKTESTTIVDIPMFLQNKWGAEKTAKQNSDMTAAKTPRNYLIKWLSDWVREYGVDGFRCDTARHVDKAAWGELKNQASLAFEEWKAKNPEKAAAYGAGTFWTTGENFGMGVTAASDYYTVGKFDSMINFTLKDTVVSALSDASKIDSSYAGYAGVVNAVGAQGNVLSYISSHDTNLFFKDYSKGDKIKQKLAGTLLLLAPGAAQIYYGDETGRNSTIVCSDKYQYTRSDMNWSTIDNDILTHWQKVGKFRQKHFAVGAGAHAKISTTPYIFSRVKDNDKIICGITGTGDVTVDVSSIFTNGTVIDDYYTGAEYTVADGKVTIPSANNKGTILLEAK